MGKTLVTTTTRHDEKELNRQVRQDKAAIGCFILVALAILAVGIDWCVLRAKLREGGAEIFGAGGADDSGDFGAVD